MPKTVKTVETLKIGYWINELLKNKNTGVLIIGGAGTGKSTIIEECLSNMIEDYDISRISLSYYTDSLTLQSMLEDSIEKKVGNQYGPNRKKNLIYYLNDLNAPNADEYQTVQAHAILRQYFDHKHWYDRQKLTLKVIENSQYIASIKPNIGNVINQRLQRHFSKFAISFPTQVDKKWIVCKSGSTNQKLLIKAN